MDLLTHDMATGARWCGAEATSGVASVSVPAPAGHPMPPPFLRAAVMQGLNRYRLHVGDLIVDLRHYPRRTSIDIHNARRRALILIPLTQPIEVVTDAAHVACPAGISLLFAREDRATTVWPNDAWGLAIHFQRDRFNAAASAALGDGRRLQPVAAVLTSGGGAQTAAQIVAMMADGAPQPGPSARAVEDQLYRWLADHLIAQNDRDDIVAPVRPVSEAMRLVRADHGRTYNTEMLATLVGVTGQTLRKGFRSCLGLSVRDFIQTVRLDRAHDALSGLRDGRPIAEIARSAGFADAPPFSRAYLKRFGEPPSQTRARAVRAAPV